MHVDDVGDISSTPMGCNAMYVGDLRDHKNLQYTQNGMVWLKSTQSQLSKTFCGLKIPWILRKLWAKTDKNNAAMLLMSHVRDVGDVKYLNKRSKATLYRAMLFMSEMSEIFQYYEITVLRYFTSLNYIVYNNSNYSNQEILWINTSNYMKLRIKALY